MKRLFAYQTAVLLVIFALAENVAYCAVEPSLQHQKEVIVTPGIITQDGPRTFVGNEGLFAEETANFAKIFGRGRPTTLWSHDRRVKCYEHAVRVAVQLASIDPHTIATNRWQTILRVVGQVSQVVKDATGALSSLKTGYIKEYGKFDVRRNDLSQLLREFSPKSKHGIPIRTTNLQKVSYVLMALDWFTTCGNYVIGAALEHALACDAALDRLDEVRGALDRVKANGYPVDGAWFEALDRAESNLTRSENYYGALMITLNDHKKEIISKGITTAYPVIMKNVFHAKMAHYVGLFLKHKHTDWTASHVKSVASGAAVLWTWSILATYYTIDGLLDQHEKAQASVAAATLDEFLHQNITSGGDSSESTEMMILQNQMTYFHKMEKASSGKLTGFHDVASWLFGDKWQYAEAKDYFKSRKEELENKLLLKVQEVPQPLSTPGPVPGGRSILIILDTSGSMKDSLPGSGETKIDSARKAVQRLLDTTAGPVEWALMIFGGCKPILLVDFTEDASRISEALSRVKAAGKTPLAISLGKAGQYLQQNGNYITCDVVLLSDGEDTCGGNPVQAAQDLYGQSIDFEQWMKP